MKPDPPAGTPASDPTATALPSTPPVAAERPSPCQSCGACCAAYRVSFSWHECDDSLGGRVPTGLTARLDAKRRAMKGTLVYPLRCVALDGELGRQVSCRIYAQRPSPCRLFDAWDAAGKVNPHCNKARAGIGLAPLQDLDPA